MRDNLQIMQTFTEKKIPSLSVATLAALELFTKEGFSKVQFRNFKKPLVIGSGNAIVTARILFSNSNAIFANESNYKEALKRDIDGVFIFSASGGKHAPIIAKEVLSKKKKCELITCTKNSQAELIIGSQNTIVTSKNREPYTYNTSTYLGWILNKTKEDPKKIINFIKKRINPILPKNLKKYNGYLLVTPDNLGGVNQLFEVKFIELFGRNIARDVKTYEEMRHAITVVPNKKELAIQFGKGKFDFENNILQIPLPKDCDVGTLMAIGYYVIGKIQEQNIQYFKNNIIKYITRNKRGEFGKSLSVIVE